MDEIELPRFKKILAVVDPRDDDQPALARAVHLAAAVKARVTAVALVHEDLPNLPEGLPRGSLTRRRNDVLRHYKAWLAREVRRAKRGRPPVRVGTQVVWEKRVSRWVLRNASLHDLVVKSGRRSETWLHTPVDWDLIRSCGVPLLLVADRHWSQRRHVMAAVDLGTHVRDKRRLNGIVAGAGRALADGLDCELHVTYVPPVTRLLRALGIADRAEATLKGRGLAQAFVDGLAASGIEVDAMHVKAGPPEKVLVSVAARQRAGIVVIGSVGRRGLAGEFVGNTAERELRLLKADLLVVKP